MHSPFPPAALIEAGSMMTITFTAHVPDALILALAMMLLNRATSIATRVWQGRKPMLIAASAA